MEFWDGYDLGFEEGSWYGYLFAIDRLKQLRARREVTIITGTILVTVPLTLLGIKAYNHIKSKSKKLLTS